MKPLPAAFFPSAYYAGLWVLLAEQYRYGGAAVVFLLGVGLGLSLLRNRSAQEGSAVVVPSAPLPSLQESVQATSAEPEVRERPRARFLGALGHELRNPLNAVTGFSDMLLSGADGPLNTEQERSVRTIRAGAERLLRLVSSVVDQARLDAGTLRLQQQWVAPAELVQEVTSFVASRVGDREVLDAVDEGLPRVFVDRPRTVQALVGLAVLVVRSSHSDVSLRVGPPRRDQVGRGFVQFDLMTNLKDSSADTLSIVERLERPTGQVDALGLEVSVARSIVQAQGGRIWTEAGTAGSLRVCMTLPTSAG